MESREPTEEGAKHAGPHVMPLGSLIGIWVALLLLTGATYAAARMELGSLSLAVALGIAAFKATLVALYFMHLRYERSFLGFIFIAALFFMALLIGITLIDSANYSGTLIPGYAPGMNR